jgi:hypothetical protein
VRERNGPEGVVVLIGKEADEDDFGLELIGLVAKAGAEMACVACLGYEAQWIFVRLSNIVCYFL